MGKFANSQSGAKEVVVVVFDRRRRRYCIQRERERARETGCVSATKKKGEPADYVQPLDLAPPPFGGKFLLWPAKEDCYFRSNQRKTKVYSHKHNTTAFDTVAVAVVAFFRSPKRVKLLLLGKKHFVEKRR